MKTRITTHYRPFTKHNEKPDAGYYTDLKKNKAAKIEVDIGEPVMEQILTMFHEYTHHVFDVLTQYEFEPKKKKISKRNDNNELKDSWKDQHDTIQVKNKTKKELKEEIICMKIEKAIKRILKKEIPTEFQKKFFESK